MQDCVRHDLCRFRVRQHWQDLTEITTKQENLASEGSVATAQIAKQAVKAIQSRQWDHGGLVPYNDLCPPQDLGPGLLRANGGRGSSPRHVDGQTEERMRRGTLGGT